MFGFRLLGFDVRVRVMHFVMAALLTAPRGDDVTGNERLLLWAVSIVIVFLSVLVHELGHALAARAVGAKANIFLYEMGGVTTFRHKGRMGPIKSIFITLAGPVAGLLVGALIVAGKRAAGEIPPLQESIFNVAIFVNIGWSLLNLVPIVPLDGGHIARQVLNVATGGRGALLAAVLSAIAGVTMAVVLGFGFQVYFGAVFFAVLAVQNVRAVWQHKDALFDDRFTRALDEVSTQMATGDTAGLDARLAKLLLEVKSPAVRARVQELSCWCAIAEGRVSAASARAKDLENKSPDLIAVLEAYEGEAEKAIKHLGKTPRDDVAPFVQAAHVYAAIRARDVETSVALIDAYKDALDPEQLATDAERLLDEGFYYLSAALAEQAFGLRPMPDAAKTAALAHLAQASQGDALTWLEKAAAAALEHGGPGWARDTLADERFESIANRPRFVAMVTEAETATLPL